MRHFYDIFPPIFCMAAPAPNPAVQLIALTSRKRSFVQRNLSRFFFFMEQFREFGFGNGF